MKSTQPHGFKMKLDVGCGDYCRGDVCFDITKTKECNIVGDASSLPFQNNCFEDLIAQALLEHLENPTQALEQFIRVLKPNGTVTMIIPKPWFTNNSRFHLVRFFLNLPMTLSPKFLRFEFMSLRRLKTERRMQHKRVITRRYIEQQADKLGFEIMEFKEIEDIFFSYFQGRKRQKLARLFQFKPKLYDCHKIVLKKNKFS